MTEHTRHPGAAPATTGKQQIYDAGCVVSTSCAIRNAAQALARDPLSHAWAAQMQTLLLAPELVEARRALARLIDGDYAADQDPTLDPGRW